MDAERTVVVAFAEGLHARPASLFVKLANSFPGEIVLEAKGKGVNAKSILNVLSLGVGCGEAVTLRAKGARAAEAVDALSQLLSMGDRE